MRLAITFNLYVGKLLTLFSRKKSFFFWWIKRQYINEKRHFKEAPLSIQEVYKKTFTHGLSNQQNLQLKWDQKQKDPWTTPTDYKVKPIYTPETYALHSQKPYCFFPSKQSKRGTRVLHATLSSFPFPHKALPTPITLLLLKRGAPMKLQIERKVSSINFWPAHNARGCDQ